MLVGVFMIKELENFQENKSPSYTIKVLWRGEENHL